MNAARHAGSIIAEERGGVIALVAVSLPVLILFAAFVLDVGNWFAHKRDMQKQADAAALAGGGSFSIPCSNDFVETETRRYSGIATAQYNAERPANAASTSALINSTNYPHDGGLDFSDGGRPCETSFVDVKMTEADIPLFFKIIPGLDSVLPAITSHARVEIRKTTSATGSMPIGVEDVNPVRGAAIFINEDTQAILAVRELTRRGQATLNGRTLIQWDNADNAAPVNIGAQKNGVVIALSGSANWSLSGSISDICGQALVACIYRTSSTDPWNGLRFLRGYQPTAGTGSATAPIVRDAFVYNVTCSDASAPGFILNGNCTAGVKAQVDFGTGANDPSASPTNAQVKVPGYGCPGGGNGGCALTYNASGDNAGYWTTNSSFLTFPSGGGPLRLDFNWKTASGSGTITGFQRVFSASTLSDPIEFAQVSNADTGSIGVTSLPYGTHNLVVTIGVRGGLENSSPTDPAIIMRVAGDSGSQNGALDCDAGRTFKEEIAYGCETPYQLNLGQPCPNSTQPKNCVPIETGDRLGQFRQGMDIRLGSCPPNNWPNVASGDPRAVPVMIVPFGSFSGSGQTEIPIINFGHFYVTGWDGGTCADNEPYPGTGSSNGNMWGHFTKYVDALNNGQGGDDMCDFNSFGGCVAVMTQ